MVVIFLHGLQTNEGKENWCELCYSKRSGVGRELVMDEAGAAGWWHPDLRRDWRLLQGNVGALPSLPRVGGPSLTEGMLGGMPGRSGGGHHMGRVVNCSGHSAALQTQLDVRRRTGRCHRLLARCRLLSPQLKLPPNTPVLPGTR